VEEAKKAVSGINKGNLDELKSLRMPPEPVHNVLTAVLRVFQTSGNTWADMKKFLSNRGVIEDIVAFDPRSITPDIRRDVEE
jgi:dynein heavy chain 2